VSACSTACTRTSNIGALAAATTNCLASVVGSYVAVVHSIIATHVADADLQIGNEKLAKNLHL
jgi:hypothetical protein